MPFSDIIHAIDAQLVRLIEARDLLANTVRTKSSSKRQSARATGKKARKFHTAPAAQSEKQSRKKAPHRQSTAKRTATGTPGKPEARKMSYNLPAAVLSLPEDLESIAAQTNLESTPPIKGETSLIVTAPNKSFRAGRSRNKKENVKTPTALSGTIPTGVVVVSAEEARRAREIPRQSSCAHFVPPTTESAGRRAFEALFADDSLDRTLPE